MAQSLVHTLVRDCMSTALVTVGPYDTLARAWELMTTHHIRRLPVVAHGRTSAIITMSDVLALTLPDPARRATLAEVAEQLGHLTVGAVARAPAICVYDNDTLGHAAELLLEHKIGGLPVVDAEQRLVGMITESDLFRLMARQWRADNEAFAGVAHRD